MFENFLKLKVRWWSIWHIFFLETLTDNRTKDKWEWRYPVDYYLRSSIKKYYFLLEPIIFTGHGRNRRTQSVGRFDIANDRNDQLIIFVTHFTWSDAKQRIFKESDHFSRTLHCIVKFLNFLRPRSVSDGSFMVGPSCSWVNVESERGAATGQSEKQNGVNKTRRRH